MTKEEAIEILSDKSKKMFNAQECIEHLTRKKQALDMAIKALEQEPCDMCEYATSGGCQYDDIAEVIPTEEKPCDDAISRQAVKAYKYHRMIYPNFEDYVDMLPPVNPQPKTGYWIKHNTGHSIYYDCSLCSCCAPCTETADSFIWKLSNFCPDCGTRMMGSKESEEE